MSFRERQLSCSQSNSPYSITNWKLVHPIDEDVKIASKAIALRIKEAIVKLAHCDQTGYVSDRNIGESNSLDYQYSWIPE